MKNGLICMQASSLHCAMLGRAKLQPFPSNESNTLLVPSPAVILAPVQACLRGSKRHSPSKQALESTGLSTRRSEALIPSKTSTVRLPNVTRWINGQMVLRWVGSALHKATTGFRCVRGFRDMKQLRNAQARSVKLDSTVQLNVA